MQYKGLPRASRRCIEWPAGNELSTLLARRVGWFRALLGLLLIVPDDAQPSGQAFGGQYMEETVVTARKRAEDPQTIPVAMSVYRADQIDALKVRGLGDLAVAMPNVALDDIGTQRGTANLSIRGLGINSSIPSIDPSVGVVVDGVYMGTNAGVLLDAFDLTSIEVLRGPQGSLYGRNVTGGAILLNTRKPTQDFEFRLRGGVEGGREGGLDKYQMTTISGPLGDGVLARLTSYYHDDDGAFVNDFNGEEFGAFTQKMLRPVLVLSVDKTTELVLRYQYTELDGDAPAVQSHTNGSGVDGTPLNHERDSFDFAIDARGYQRGRSDFLNTEFNRDVAFGDGTITNIAAWRRYNSETGGDVDAQPINLFYALGWLDAEQLSNELRYDGVFAQRAHVTAGVYYFRNQLAMHEQRDLLGATTADGSPVLRMDGGGKYQVETSALFASLDYDLTSQWMLTTGGRWSVENKRARVVSLNRNINSPCNIVETGDCPFDFVSDHSWNSFSPKIGLMYHIDSHARVYGHWTRSFRSGGYNLRNTAVDTVNFGPGPFDQERVDSFEIGVKSRWQRGQLSAALFLSRISNIQREVNLADPVAGVVQVIKNTADVEIPGLEIEGSYALTGSLWLMASLGAIDANYTRLKFDLNSDGVIDGNDKSLDLPRAADLTYSLSLNHEWRWGHLGQLNTRISYAHRDESAYTDDNLGMIPEQNMLDMSMNLKSADGHWSYSAFGRNLLDEVKYGGDNQLPATLGGVPLGGTFAPLARGRSFGIEVTYRY